MNSSPAKPDLAGRPDIIRLVDAFYQRVQADDLIGFIFTEIARTDWAAHLPRMYDFWEKVLFRTGTFQGNPLAVHARLVAATPMGQAQFDRWLALFVRTVDDLFTGEHADHIKNAAADMAKVIHRKINGLPDPVWPVPVRVGG
jgi:hemoglobin